MNPIRESVCTVCMHVCDASTIILTILIDAGVTSKQIANMQDATSSSDTGYESCSVLSWSETSSSGASQLTKVRLRVVLHTLQQIHAPLL